MKTVREAIAEHLDGENAIDWRANTLGIADSILSALKEAGYQVVPVEPTEAMIKCAKMVAEEADINGIR